LAIPGDVAIKIEDFFNQSNIVDLSFFNFRNAITAAYFANRDLEVLKVNDNFRKFFPVLGNLSHAYFPDILAQLGVAGDMIETWEKGIRDDGFVLIPQINITDDDGEHVYSLMSTRTTDDSFSYLNGIQGQFVNRTEEWSLRREREELLEEKLRDRKTIEENSRHLQLLANRLAKYLSPQIYDSIFAENADTAVATSRKNLTIFFSDIEKFTDLSDTMEPERLSAIVNLYLSEMSSIAIECGGTIDKFIGDAVMVFFGDPESQGAETDAFRTVEMALRMKHRISEMKGHWQRLGAPNGLNVRMGITTGFCTVGNFGSNQRLDYTVLGSPVNLAARLQGMAAANDILITEETKNLVAHEIECVHFADETPKGFARPVQIYKVVDFFSEEHRAKRVRLSHRGDHVEVNVIDSSDIKAVISELKRIQLELEAQYLS
jgi:adenylate cyclase